MAAFWPGFSVDFSSGHGIERDRTYFTADSNRVLRNTVSTSKGFIGNNSALLKIPLAEHTGMKISYRQNVAEESLQIGVGTDGSTIEIDIDIHNPSYSLKQEFLHSKEVLDNHTNHKLTDPYDIDNEKFWECMNDNYIS